MSTGEIVLYNSELAPSALERQDFRHMLLFSAACEPPAVGPFWNTGHWET